MSTFEPHTTSTPDRRVKIAYLVFGLLFLGLAGIWAMAETGTITTDSLPFLAPGVLIAAGVIGLVASLASGRNRPAGTTSTTSSSTASPPTGTGFPWEDTDDTTPTEEIR